MNKYSLKSLITIFSLFCFSIVSAQHSNSLYFMNHVPQSNQLNPALQPVCNFYLGIPGTNFEINAGNSAVGFSDVLTYNADLDSLVLPMYDEKTKSDFLSKLKETSYIFTDFRSDLLTFGFRIQQSYLSFNISERMEAYGYIPKDLFKFGMNLNYSSLSMASESFDFSNLGFKAQWFREYGIGISTEINPNFTFGFRAKLLYGIASVTTSNSEIKLDNTSMYEWQTKAITDVNVSVPGLLVYETDGKVDSIDYEDIKDAKQAYDLFGKTKNVGFGMDIGFVAQPAKGLSLSASIVDLGFINWRNNVHNLSIDGEYDYKGVEIYVSDTTDIGEALLDTLEKTYDAKTSQEGYTTGISGKMYAAIQYELVKGLSVGALTRMQLIKNSVRPEYTFSLNIHPSKYWGTTVSYNIANGVYDNLGIGMYLRPIILPLQWYFVVDRIPLHWDKNTGDGTPFVPKYARAVNFRMGFNLAIGCNRKPKANKDKPLLDI